MFSELNFKEKIILDTIRQGTAPRVGGNRLKFTGKEISLATKKKKVLLVCTKSYRKRMSVATIRQQTEEKKHGEIQCGSDEREAHAPGRDRNVCDEFWLLALPRSIKIQFFFWEEASFHPMGLKC